MGERLCVLKAGVPLGEAVFEGGWKQEARPAALSNLKINAFGICRPHKSSAVVQSTFNPLVGRRAVQLLKDFTAFSD